MSFSTILSAAIDGLGVELVRVEADVNVSAGEYAPMWMTSNRYGLASERPNSGWLRAGVTYDQPLKRNFCT